MRGVVGFSSFLLTNVQVYQTLSLPLPFFLLREIFYDLLVGPEAPFQYTFKKVVFAILKPQQTEVFEDYFCDEGENENTDVPQVKERKERVKKEKSSEEEKDEDDEIEANEGEEEEAEEGEND